MTNKAIGYLRVFNKEKEEIAFIELQLGNNMLGRLYEDENGKLEVIEDSFLSRKHFVIETEKDQYNRIRFFLRDNISTNTTWLKYNKKGTVKKLENNDLLELSDGDTILGGETYFTLEINPEWLGNNESGSNTTLIRD
jgi:pSer/pThr/pTyr-binding forkhead associated (FHA) protein